MKLHLYVSKFLQPTENIEVFWDFRIFPGNGIMELWPPARRRYPYEPEARTHYSLRGVGATLRAGGHHSIIPFPGRIRKSQKTSIFSVGCRNFETLNQGGFYGKMAK